tara:strand:+ start:498 stop:671 length:174 start_codon:yes stop_codon:yes gene_type:complete
MGYVLEALAINKAMGPSANAKVISPIPINTIMATLMTRSCPIRNFVMGETGSIKPNG